MDITTYSKEQLDLLELQTFREREAFARAIEQAQKDYQIANNNLLAIQEEQAKRVEPNKAEEDNTGREQALNMIDN